MFTFAQKWPQIFSGQVETKHSGPAAPANRKQAALGRGRDEHRHLQQVIKQWTEDLGWSACIDCFVSNKEGSVDVALRRKNQSIACEISITTPADYEVENLRKCLAAGFEQVVSVSPDEGQLDAIKQIAARQLSSRELDRVRWLTPWQLVQFVQGQSPSGGR